MACYEPTPRDIKRLNDLIERNKPRKYHFHVVIKESNGAIRSFTTNYPYESSKQCVNTLAFLRRNVGGIHVLYTFKIKPK